MKIFAPQDLNAFINLLPTIYNEPGPAYIRVNHRVSLPTTSQLNAKFDAIVISYGTVADHLKSLQSDLAVNGATFKLYIPNQIYPVPLEVIDAILNSDKPIITIEDHIYPGSLAHHLQGIVKERKRINFIGLDNHFHQPLLLDELLKAPPFCLEHLSSRITAIVNEVTH